MKKIFLITQRRIVDSHGIPCDSLESTYIEFFGSFGICLIPIPNIRSDKLSPYLRILSKGHGLILSGGNDVCPNSYTTEISKNNSYSKIRDETEETLLNFAVKNGIPVLGICRGMHLINLFFGGGLIENIEKETNEIHDKGEIHELNVIHNQTAAFISTDRWEMKSYHKQGVTTSVLASTLKPFITSKNINVIEGLFHPKYPVAGIQFHPERENDNPIYVEKLINTFLKKKLFWKPIQ